MAWATKSTEKRWEQVLCLKYESMIVFTSSLCEASTLCETTSKCLLLQVSDLIKESRQALADSLFSWTCQSPLSKDDTLALIGHLETVTAQADGSLDSVNLALVMALLYCLDVSFIEQGTEDREGKNLTDK